MLSAFCIKYLKAEKIYFNSKFFIFSPAKFIINFCLFSILGMKFSTCKRQLYWAMVFNRFGLKLGQVDEKDILC